MSRIGVTSVQRARLVLALGALNLALLATALGVVAAAGPWPGG